MADLSAMIMKKNGAYATYADGQRLGETYLTRTGFHENVA